MILETVVSGEELLVAPKRRFSMGTLYSIVIVMSPGQCMATLDLGLPSTRTMISDVRTFGQAGPYRPASSCSSLRSHDSDQVGCDVCSPMHESGPVVPLESMVESSGTMFGWSSLPI